MKVDNVQYRTIWLNETDPTIVEVIDQRHLPHTFVVERLRSVSETATAIKDMHVRGAGLIGATAGYGMYLAALAAPQTGIEPFLSYLQKAGEILKATRPTAVNLEWAVQRQLNEVVKEGSPESMIQRCRQTAIQIANEDAEFCKQIGLHGVAIIEEIYKRKGGPVQILTHCNAGWLAFVDYGSATAPIYEAQRRGIPIHVWVDETRPRNQGAGLTAWELCHQGIPHSIIVDNAGGHLLQHGLVDLVIVGSDRSTVTGDVCNKIGTYLKALAAKDNNVPFYAALPSSTFDWNMRNGILEIPIEERDPDEVRYVTGRDDSGKAVRVRVTPESSEARNFGFDVTPARLVTAIITERGVCRADENSVLELFPEHDRRIGTHISNGSP